MTRRYLNQRSSPVTNWSEGLFEGTPVRSILKASQYIPLVADLLQLRRKLIQLVRRACNWKRAIQEMHHEACWYRTWAFSTSHWCNRLVLSSQRIVDYDQTATRINEKYLMTIKCAELGLKRCWWECSRQFDSQWWLGCDRNPHIFTPKKCICIVQVLVILDITSWNIISTTGVSSNKQVSHNGVINQRNSMPGTHMTEFDIFKHNCAHDDWETFPCSGWTSFSLYSCFCLVSVSRRQGHSCSKLPRIALLSVCHKAMVF